MPTPTEAKTSEQKANEAANLANETKALQEVANTAGDNPDALTPEARTRMGRLADKLEEWDTELKEANFDEREKEHIDEFNRAAQGDMIKKFIAALRAMLGQDENQFSNRIKRELIDMDPVGKFDRASEKLETAVEAVKDRWDKVKLADGFRQVGDYCGRVRDYFRGKSEEEAKPANQQNARQDSPDSPRNSTESADSTSTPRPST